MRMILVIAKIMPKWWKTQRQGTSEESRRERLKKNLSDRGKPERATYAIVYVSEGIFS